MSEWDMLSSGDRPNDVCTEANSKSNTHPHQMLLTVGNMTED